MSNETCLISTIILHENYFNNNVINKETVNNSMKNVKRSTEERKKGNEYFRNHDCDTHKDIHRCYCNSIAFAPNNSKELALGYSNRSLFLLHIDKYIECIQDIVRAFCLTKSNILKVKLLCRKAKCLTMLGSPKNVDVLKSAEVLFKKIKIDNKKKPSLLRLINQTKKYITNKMQKEQNDVKDEATPKSTLHDNFPNVFDSVNIKYNETYGRHLVANHDFKPGDIIFTEPLYGKVLTEKKQATNCSHCLHSCWSGIPCEKCTVMFCSEEYKKEAFAKYHDIECKIIPFVRTFSEWFINLYHCSIRMLIMGLKEAGSITKLKNDVMLVDTCKDKVSKGFLIKNNKFKNNGLMTFYSLNGEFISVTYRNNFSVYIVLVLIAFAKFTSVFGRNFKLNNVLDLLANDTKFFGVLLFTLCEKQHFNNYTLYNTAYEDECDDFKFKEDCLRTLCCARGLCVSLVSCLMNSSCFPNTRRCFTEDGKILIYASHPIKKGSQIFDSYCGLYYDTKLIDRKRQLWKHNFACNCVACKNDWPPMLDFPFIPEVMMGNMPIAETVLYLKCVEIFNSLDDREHHFDRIAVQTLSECIIKAFKQLPQPSYTTCLLLFALHEIMEITYGLQPELISKCKDDP